MQVLNGSYVGNIANNRKRLDDSRDIEDMTYVSTVFVTRLSQAKETAIPNFFGRARSIEGIIFFPERKYVFISFLNHFQANQAISSLNDTQMLGVKIRVLWARRQMEFQDSCIIKLEK